MPKSFSLCQGLGPMHSFPGCVGFQEPVGSRDKTGGCWLPRGFASSCEILPKNFIGGFDDGPREYIACLWRLPACWTGSAGPPAGSLAHLHLLFSASLARSKQSAFLSLWLGLASQSSPEPLHLAGPLTCSLTSAPQVPAQLFTLPTGLSSSL